MPLVSGREIISTALRLIGQLAEGENPSVSALGDGMRSFNTMVDSWNLERLAVYGTRTQIFNWPAGQATQNMPSPLPADEPLHLDSSTYFVDPSTGISYSITMVNQEQYNSISLKSATGPFPSVMYSELRSPASSNSVPVLTMSVYPVPDRNLTFNLVVTQVLEKLETVGDGLNLLPGYDRCYKYNLACEIAPEYGVEPSATVRRIAMISKRNLKRINNPDLILRMPANLIANRYRYNIYTGGGT